MAQGPLVSDSVKPVIHSPKSVNKFLLIMGGLNEEVLLHLKCTARELCQASISFIQVMIQSANAAISGDGIPVLISDSMQLIRPV